MRVTKTFTDVPEDMLMRDVTTLLDVGETALVLVGAAVLDFFFLILMPGTGAEFRASRNPVASMAAMTLPSSSPLSQLNRC